MTLFFLEMNHFRINYLVQHDDRFTSLQHLETIMTYLLMVPMKPKKETGYIYPRQTKYF